ncbi:MAG: RNA polymerase sigma factor [Candidatus Saccharibacteria bacterium]
MDRSAMHPYPLTWYVEPRREAPFNVSYLARSQTVVQDYLGTYTRRTMPNDELIQQSYDSYADQIYRFLFWQTGDALLAEDLTGEVFFRAWKHRAKFSDANHRAWLYRVARNLITDNWRKKKDLSLPEDYEIVLDYDLAATAEQDEELARVRTLVQELPDKFRTVVLLRFFEQLSCREVSVIMGTSEGNVRILQYRALKELKGKLS